MSEDKEQLQGEQPKAKPGPKPKSDQKAEQPKAKGDTYRNKSKVNQRVCGRIVRPGAEVTLTDADKENIKNMKRLDRAVDIGYLEKV